MAYTTPTTQSTGTLITATIWNTDIVNNVIALRTGAIALTSQATGDVIYASSSTQLGRVAIGTTGYVLTSNGSAPAWSNTPTLTGTNITGVPISTGISGLGTGVATFLATPSSANLASAVTDETGSGALVFATSPTLVTPVLGAASGTSLSLAGALSGVTTLAASGVVTLSDTTDASSSTTGALKVAGGLGVAKKLYVGTDAVVGSTLAWGGGSAISSSSNVALLNAANTFTAFGTHTFSAGGTGSNQMFVQNTTSGAANYSAYLLQSGNSVMGLYSFSQGFTTSGANVASGIKLEAEAAGGVSILASHASGDVRIYSRNALAATFGASQTLTLTGDASIPSAKKLYLDGGGDTYLYEVAANTVRCVVGGSLGFDVLPGSFSIPATSKFYLDGGGDTYIYEHGANDVRIITAGVIHQFTTSGFAGVYPTTASAANLYASADGQYVSRSTSSIRYKHDIAPLNTADAQTALMTMRPVTYRGKTDEDQRRHVGFIAEEMAEIAPLLCTYDEGGESGTPNYVTYDRVTAYLVAVVQKQQQDIDALKARIQ